MGVRSLNRITLIGNLTRDPELRYTPQGTAVCTFGVATNRSWTTAEGEVKESAQFHRVVAWQKLAELCNQLLSKGKKIFLEGRMTYRSFEGKDEVRRTIAEIVMDDFIVFDYPSRRKGKSEIEEEQVSEEEVESEKDTDESSSEEKKKEKDKDKKKGTEKEKNKKDKKKEKEEEKEEGEKEKKEEEEEVSPDDIPF